MLTEEQAKLRWCPFSRVLLPVNQSGNRISTFHLEAVRKSGDTRDIAHYEQQQADCRCIASHCMSWRWAGYREVPSATVQNQDEAHGFCGLAGKP